MKPLDNVKFVVIDEAQDMAHLLVNIVDRLFRNAQEIWWAGDANQAIYGFAAADARIFIERARKASTRIVLRQTHRFGQEIVDLSTKIIRRAQDRMDVDVIGLHGKKHNIHSTGEFRPVVGQALILHRHVLGCQAVAASYIAAGLPFRNERGRDPLGANVRVRAFKAMRDLADGGDISMGAVHRLVDDLMPSILIGEDGLKKRLVVHGAKKKLQDAQNEGAVRLVDLVRSGILTQDGADIIRMKSYRLFRHADDLAYYDRVIENGYDLEGNCPIITTMHGSKGRQAEQVIVFNEMGRKCWDDPDTEHRLAYVAATRTRGELEICNERTLDWAEMPYEYPVNNV
jgi:superfamily I DNA/RNA helicase